MSRIAQLWRTSTVRLTALFILFFVLFSVLLLAFITYQSSVQLQRQQADNINRELRDLKRLDEERGIRGLILAVDRLARQPGPGLYVLADPSGQIILGNVPTLPASVLQTEGVYSFDYDRPPPLGLEDVADVPEGNALVRSVILPSGLILVVGRDVVERRGFTAIILQTFIVGVVGILLASLLAGVVTALRVLRRVDAITSTSRKIMSGNLSERVPVTRRNDEFDALATSLNAMLDRIEQLMQGLKEVTDNVAHDLKTPLTRLRNKAEAALLESADQATRQEALETTLAESDKLIRTFNALLSIARAEAGAPSGAFADVDLSTVVDDVAELYGPVVEERGMELATEVAPDIRLRANRELIGQALVNLVENAMKYYEQKDGQTGSITLKLSRADNHVLIEVGDNGPGIPAEDRKRVVERFVRLEKSRTEPGSGLGLSLVDAVARLHRGEFRIEDNAPGTRAILDLPLG
jgi:signal transduction histidine kinase